MYNYNNRYRNYHAFSILKLNLCDIYKNSQSTDDILFKNVIYYYVRYI